MLLSIVEDCVDGAVAQRLQVAHYIDFCINTTA